MNTELTNEQRVINLYNKHYKKLINYANTLTLNIENSEDLISDIFEKLLTNVNDKIYFDDNFNLYYLNKMIYSSFINAYNKTNKENEQFKNNFDFSEIELEYDYENDKKEETLLNLYIECINEIANNRKNTYAKQYIKYKLYSTPVNQLAKNKIKKNTLYRNFSKYNKIVEENFEQKKMNLNKNNVNINIKE